MSFAGRVSMSNMNSFVIVVLALIAATQANVVYRKLKVEDRIVGGEIAPPNYFPYQAFLLMTDDEGRQFQCGGSLLTTSRILTAAHCVKGYASIRVLLGAHELNKYEPNRQERSAIESAYHGGYDEQTIANDIAILTLDSPVELNEYVKLTTLPRRADVDNTYAGELATVTGWGIYSDFIGRPSDVLRYVSSIIVTNDVCSRDYGYISPSQICINGKLLKSSCQGDSGGPLVTGNDRVQIGLVSFGRVEGCEKGFDAVFTRITSYLDWIASTGNVIIN